MITKADIRLVRSLADKRTRDELGLFVAEGEKLISEILSSDLRIHRLFATDDVLADADAERVARSQMERISLLKTPSSCVAVVCKPHREASPDKLRGRLTLALDDVQNPGNVGTIIRIADWFGIENIVCSHSTADCFNPKVVQASMGAVLRVSVSYTDLDDFLVRMRQLGEPVFGMTLDGRDMYAGQLADHGVLVMGNEGKGLRPSTLELLTDRLYIPSYPADRSGSESLNVAVATAVAVAEFRRRASL